MAAAEKPELPQNKGKTRNPNMWQPGQSGNPGGRPKGLATAARELIGNDPKRLLTVLLDIAENKSAKDSDRRAAIETYLDRAYGKAPAYAPIDGENPLDLEQVDKRILAVLDELAAVRQAKAVGGGETRPVADTGTA